MWVARIPLIMNIIFTFFCDSTLFLLSFLFLLLYSHLQIEKYLISAIKSLWTRYSDFRGLLLVTIWCTCQSLNMGRVDSPVALASCFNSKFWPYKRRSSMTPQLCSLHCFLLLHKFLHYIAFFISTHINYILHTSYWNFKYHSSSALINFYHIPTNH